MFSQQINCGVNFNIPGIKVAKFYFFFPLFQAGPLLCYSPKDEGLCSSSVPRYYYDTKSKSCKEFKYTGCGGNANNFVTETDCYNVCGKGKFFFFSFFVFYQTKADKPIQISVTGVQSVLLLTLLFFSFFINVCFLEFGIQYFQRKGKLRCNTKSF